MDRKKIVWGILSVFIAVLSIWAVVAQSKKFSIKMLEEFIIGADKMWLLAAVLCSFGFIWFEGCALVRIGKSLGYQRTLGQGTVYGGADIYFSAITPSASGGQPASAYFMIKDGMPASAVTAVLLINLVMYTVALLFWGVICLVTRFHIFWQLSWLSKIFIFIGCIVLSTLAVAFYMLLRKADILYKICSSVIDFLDRIHLLRHGDKKRAWLLRTTEEYKECAAVITGKGSMLWELFFWNVMQRLSQLAVSFMIFMSAGKSVKDALDIGIAQCFVAMGSNCVPIPGAMGVADYIMLDNLNHIVGRETAVSMEILCRGITFYGSVVIGFIIVIVGYINRKKRKRNAGIF